VRHAHDQLLLLETAPFDLFVAGAVSAFLLLLHFRGMQRPNWTGTLRLIFYTSGPQRDQAVTYSGFVVRKLKNGWLATTH
jgi:hypothetical protein